MGIDDYLNYCKNYKDDLMLIDNHRIFLSEKLASMLHHNIEHLDIFALKKPVSHFYGINVMNTDYRYLSVRFLKTQLYDKYPYLVYASDGYFSTYMYSSVNVHTEVNVETKFKVNKEFLETIDFIKYYRLLKLKKLLANG